MVEQRNKNVELPRFKRSTSTWEGKVIEYLLAYPGKTAVELTGEALSAYFLVEALEGKVSDEEFRQAYRGVNENLERKIDFDSINVWDKLHDISTHFDPTNGVAPST